MHVDTLLSRHTFCQIFQTSVSPKLYEYKLYKSGLCHIFRTTHPYPFIYTNPQIMQIKLMPQTPCKIFRAYIRIPSTTQIQFKPYIPFHSHPYALPLRAAGRPLLLRERRPRILVLRAAASGDQENHFVQNHVR